MPALIPAGGGTHHIPIDARPDTDGAFRRITPPEQKRTQAVRHTDDAVDAGKRDPIERAIGLRQRGRGIIEQ
jgi:hypothetical protein